MNRLSGIAKNDQWADYLSHKLNPFSLLRQIPDQKVIELGLLHAHGLKPGWHHSGILRSNSMPPAIEYDEKVDITVAYHMLYTRYSLMSFSP